MVEIGDYLEGYGPLVPGIKDGLKLDTGPRFGDSNTGKPLPNLGQSRAFSFLFFWKRLIILFIIDLLSIVLLNIYLLH